MALSSLSHARQIKCTPDMPVAPTLAGMAARAAMWLPVLMTIFLACARPGHVGEARLAWAGMVCSAEHHRQDKIHGA